MILQIHPENPQPRQVLRAAELLRKGEVLAYPTDTLFGIGCDVLCPKAIENVSRIAGRDKKKTFSFICRDFSEADQYARISQTAFRIMKHLLPGPYTLILPATSLVPKKISEKRKTVGIRIPSHNVCQALVEHLGRPLASVSLEPEDGQWSGDAYTVHERIGHCIAAVIDGGVCDGIPSTVVDLTGDVPLLVREGKGDASLIREICEIRHPEAIPS